MSWTIHLLKNTVRVTKKCSKELFKANLKNLCEYWYDADSVATDEGILNFDPDHAEHMDYLADSRITDILVKHKVEGDICFADLEGFETPAFWGYHFDEKGMALLEGSIAWNVLKPAGEDA